MTRGLPKRGIAALMLLLATVLLCSCTGYYGLPYGTPLPLVTPEPGSEEENDISALEGGNVSIGVAQYDTLHPLFTNSEDVKQIMWLVYDGLVSLDYAQKPQAALAVHWQTQDGGLSWEVVLREDVSWQDGSSLNAADVVATVQCILDQGGLYAANVAQVESCTAAGEQKVIFRLREIDPVFPGKLAFPILQADKVTSLTALPVGTGCYAYQGQEGNRLTFVKNASYWGESPLLQSFTLVSFADEPAKCESEVDVLLLSGEMGVKYGRKPGYRSIKYTGRTYTCLLPNLQQTGLSKTLRQALRTLLNQNALVNYAVAGNGVPADWPVLPETYYWREAASLAAGDAQEAFRLLTEAGYVRRTEDGLWYRTSDTHYQAPLTWTCIAPAEQSELCLAARGVQEQLAKVGITLHIVKVATEEWTSALLAGEYHFAMMQYTLGTWPELGSLFSPEGHMNWNDYHSAELEDCLARLPQTPMAAREALFREIRAILEEDVPLIGLYLRQEMLVVRSSVLGTGRQSIYVWNPLADSSSWHLYTKEQ